MTLFGTKVLPRPKAVPPGERLVLLSRCLGRPIDDPLFSFMNSRLFRQNGGNRLRSGELSAAMEPA